MTERQSRADSFMEALTNIAVGLAVSQVANLVVLPIVLGVHVTQGAALSLGVIYTAISLVRSYVLRRAFNGRSVWQAVKGVCRWRCLIGYHDWRVSRLVRLGSRGPSYVCPDCGKVMEPLA